MVGQGLWEFAVEGIHIEKDNFGNDERKFKFSVNIALLLLETYGDRFRPKSD